MHTAPSGVKASRQTLAILLAREIGDNQTPLWFEYTGDFSQSLLFETRRQMMHHQGRKHHIERLIGERKLLDHPILKLNG